jgi:hypothetical protein
MPRYSYRNRQFLKGKPKKGVTKDISDYLRTTGFFRIKDDPAVIVNVAKPKAAAVGPATPASFKTKKAAILWALREHDNTLPKGWSLKKLNKATARLEAGLKLTAGWDKAVPVGGGDVADDPPPESAGEEV